MQLEMRRNIVADLLLVFENRRIFCMEYALVVITFFYKTAKYNF